MGWGEQPYQMELFAKESAPEPEPAPVREPLSDAESSDILQALHAGHDTLDALCTALGRGAHSITPLLMRLQIERRIIPLPGGRFKQA